MSIDSAAQIQERLAAAAASGRPLEVIGGGSKRFYGGAVEAADPLPVGDLRGVVDYQPRELICVVKPGTPLAELESVLAAERQLLAFEPPHLGEGATVGGTVACNLSGPRRFKAGAARDHLLGFQAVSGRGDVIRGGGRVVKNVTGYDLSKLMCGSFGTLAVLTELCLKVLPRAESERTLAIAGLNDEAALGALIAAARSPHDVSGLAWLPPGSRMPPMLTGMTEGATLIRLEGPEGSTAYRIGELQKLAGGADVAQPTGDESAEVWRAVRELEPLQLQSGAAAERLWRFSVPPTGALGLGRALAEAGPVRCLYDWGGGLVWAALPREGEPATLHRLAAEAGGHARLVRPAPGDGASPDWLPPQAGAREPLHRNLKAAFDPAGILNPGRMYTGW